MKNTVAETHLTYGRKGFIQASKTGKITYIYPHQRPSRLFPDQGSWLSRIPSGNYFFSVCSLHLTGRQAVDWLQIFWLMRLVPEYCSAFSSGPFIALKELSHKC